MFWLIPLKRKVLIEGIFEKEKKEFDFWKNKEFKSFEFRDFCRTCVEEWRETGKRPLMSTLAPACYGGIHTYSLNIERVVPKAGDAVKLVARETLFKRVRLYYFQKSDFVWTNWIDEEDRQEAKKGGFASIEEYKLAEEKKWHEKFYEEAMAEHGLTREEAELLAPQSSFVSSFTREAKRCGITYSEVHAQYTDRIKNPDPNMVKYCENIIGYTDHYVEQFIADGFLDLELKEHFNKCDLCNGVFVGSAEKKTKRSAEEIRKDIGLLTAREAFLQGGARLNGVTPEEYEKMHKEKMVLLRGSKDCFTAKERIAYARSGNLPAERMAHAENCPGCGRMIKADKEEFSTSGKLTGVA